MNAAILIFSRGYQSLQAKSRLRGKDFSDQQINNLHNHLLSQTLIKASKTENSDIYLSLADNFEQTVQLLRKLKINAQLIRQSGSTFADKLKHSINLLLKEIDQIILVGSDCPELSLQDLNTTLKLLANDQAVIGPNPDGGFYLMTITKSKPVNLDLILNSANQTQLALDTYKNYKWQKLASKQDIDELIHLNDYIKRTGYDFI